MKSKSLPKYGKFRPDTFQRQDTSYFLPRELKKSQYRAVFTVTAMPTFI
jgi:hypothetical protein